MRWVNFVAVADPTLTGIFIVVSPALFGWLILGAELSAAGQALGRIGGVAMFALGLASFPAAATIVVTAASRALLIYNLIAAAYLGYLGAVEKMAGVLLWPAVALHATLAILLAWNWLGQKSEMS